MSLSFTAAIEILDEAQDKIREAQAIQESMKEKIEEAETIQRKAGDTLEEALNDLKQVYALGPIGGLAPILEMMQKAVSDCHFQMIEQMNAVIEASDALQTATMEAAHQAVEDLKGN